jgi:hypothetical protein
MIFGNLRYDFGGVLPMSGLLSGNLGNSEACCGFKLSANGAAMMRRTAKYPLRGKWKRKCSGRISSHFDHLRLGMPPVGMPVAIAFFAWFFPATMSSYAGIVKYLLMCSAS